MGSEMCIRDSFWVTEETPAPIRGVSDTLHLSNTLQPPIGGSVGSFVTNPPDDWYMHGFNDEKVSDYLLGLSALKAAGL